MRSTMYTSDKSIYAQIAAIAQNGWLIVVPSSEDAKWMRELVRLWGRHCLQDIINDLPPMPATKARTHSVEVRTLAEMEQDEFNEKQAMEVL